MTETFDLKIPFLQFLIYSLLVNLRDLLFAVLSLASGRLCLECNPLSPRLTSKAPSNRIVHAITATAVDYYCNHKFFKMPLQKLEVNRLSKHCISLSTNSTERYTYDETPVRGYKAQP